MNKILFAAGIVFSVMSNAVQPITFSLPTSDGLSKINGQIDIPDCRLAKLGAVVMVGGTGLFTRNVYFGRSGTERDFIFKDLSQRFNRNCIATVRFDYRGVSCDLKSKADASNCIDQKVRAQVTDKTILDDIQVVYNFATKQRMIDPKKIVVFGHSEGTVNISRLIASGSIAPKGIMFMGGVTESPKSILHWQFALRLLEWAFAMDQNHDGVLTNDEIKAGYAGSSLPGFATLDGLLSPSGSWTKQSFGDSLESQYLSVVQDAKAHANTDPYMAGDIVFTSYQWWKRWFVDDVSVLDNLKNFGGPIEYHNGSIDSQTPGLREKAILDANQIPMRSKPNFILHGGRGHGLSMSPLYGPIEDTIADQIVSDVVTWLK